MGYVTHAGAVRMAQAVIMKRMAMAMNDKEYVEKCAAWLEAGASEIIRVPRAHGSFGAPHTCDIPINSNITGDYCKCLSCSCHFGFPVCWMRPCALNRLVDLLYKLTIKELHCNHFSLLFRRLRFSHHLFHRDRNGQLYTPGQSQPL